MMVFKSFIPNGPWLRRLRRLFLTRRRPGGGRLVIAEAADRALAARPGGLEGLKHAVAKLRRDKPEVAFVFCRHSSPQVNQSCPENIGKNGKSKG